MHTSFWLGIEQCSNRRRDGTRRIRCHNAWHSYQKPVPEKWSRFMAPVHGTSIMGRPRPSLLNIDWVWNYCFSGLLYDHHVLEVIKDKSIVTLLFLHHNGIKNYFNQKHLLYRILFLFFAIILWWENNFVVWIDDFSIRHFNRSISG